MNIIIIRVKKWSGLDICHINAGSGLARIGGTRGAKVPYLNKRPGKENF